MLRPNDTFQKNDDNEAGQKKRSATIASKTDRDDDATEHTDAAIVGAVTVTRESIAAIANIPQVETQSQEESYSQRNEQLESKRKKRKDPPQEHSTNHSTVTTQIHNEANTGFSSVEQQLIRMQLLERQQQLLQQQIQGTDSRGRLSTDTGNASALLTQLSLSQQGLQLPSLQHPSVELLLASNRSLRQQLGGTNLSQDREYELLVQHQLHQQQQQQQRSLWNIDQQLLQYPFSQRAHVRNEAAVTAVSNMSSLLNQSNRLHTQRVPTLPQEHWMLHRDAISSVGVPSIGGNAFLLGSQQPQLELPTMLSLQQSLNLARSAELRQLQLARHRIEEHQMAIGATSLRDQFRNTGNMQSGTFQSGLPWIQSDALGVGSLYLPTTLAREDDLEKLSPHQVLLRKQIEAFQASSDDVTTHTRGRNKPIGLNQVGIRCRHCGQLPVSKRRKGSTYFPATISGIYQAAQNMSSTHIQSGLCSEMPAELKAEFESLHSLKIASSGAGSPYWAESARQLGLVDTEDGIQFILSLRRGARQSTGGEMKLDDTRYDAHIL